MALRPVRPGEACGIIALKFPIISLVANLAK